MERNRGSTIGKVKSATGERQKGQSLRLTWNRRPDKQSGVPRQIRIEYPGAIYHVMSRGDRREAIFTAIWT
jgi:hypothetical protein